MNIPAMKKILFIIIGLSAAVSNYAQTHYKGSVNIETGAGINDMQCISPVISIGYAFNNWIETCGRYSFAIGKRPGISFFENNIELYAAFSPLQIDEKIFFNFNTGIIIKLQDYKEIIPTPRTGKANSGLMADAEIEWATGIYWSLFGRATFRWLFLDENSRLEMFYNAGLRLSLNIFGAAEKRTPIRKFK
jgi:hypothetical protein